jgi:hypothetical protein
MQEMCDIFLGDDKEKLKYIVTSPALTRSHCDRAATLALGARFTVPHAHLYTLNYQ